MRWDAMVGWLRREGNGLLAFLLAVALWVPMASGDDAKDGRGERTIAGLGEELFHREWMPDDPRSQGGDGLGPVYNDTSCVACHNLGAPGGGGPASKNVPILSAIDLSETNVTVDGRIKGIFKSRPGEPGKGEAKPPPDPGKKQPDVGALVALHAGFRKARSVVLHRYGTDPTYQDWRRRLFEADKTEAEMAAVLMPQPVRVHERQTKEDRATQDLMRARARATGANPFLPETIQRGDFQLILTRRNTPPLFGTGLIDAIPDAVLESAAQRADPDAPEIKGRVSRLAGGRIGRFGWKGQTPDLKEFILTACAVELGLEVPSHSQGRTPNAPHYRATKLDLDEAGCAALVAYVRSLPAPLARAASNRREANALKAGKDAFHAVGCAHCHVADLGEVKGLYSDLLLHDLGDELSDTSVYGVFLPDPHAHAAGDKTATDPVGAPAGASAKEWRTPPLWGFRDSGPYLHDGRAEDLEQAVAAHGGEAARSALKFFMLSPGERLKVEAFLKSMTAPNGIGGAAAGH